MDDAEFDEFVLQESAHLLRLSWLLTADIHDAEDLLQAALLRTWRARQRVPKLSGQRLAYVRKVLVNEHLSRRRRFWERENPAEVLPEVSDLGQGFPRDERLDVARAVSLLPPRQRAVVVLRYLEDLSEQATADVLGCRPGTVKSQASKALSSLAHRLGPSYMTGVHS